MPKSEDRRLDILYKLTHRSLDIQMPVNTQAFVDIYESHKSGYGHTLRPAHRLHGGRHTGLLVGRRKERLRPLPLTPTSNSKVIG